MKRTILILLALIVVGAGGAWYFTSLSDSKQADVFEQVTPEKINAKMENKEDFYVYFYSDDCPYCVEFSPKLEEAAKEANKKIQKLDVFEHRTDLEQFDVQAWPTLIHYKDGQEKDRLIGNQPVENAKEFLQ